MKKQFIALANVTLGKGEYEMVGRGKGQFALIRKGEAFKADEDVVVKLLALGKIKESSGGYVPEIADEDEGKVKRGRR